MATAEIARAVLQLLLEPLHRHDGASASRAAVTPGSAVTAAAASPVAALSLPSPTRPKRAAAAVLDDVALTPAMLDHCLSVIQRHVKDTAYTVEHQLHAAPATLAAFEAHRRRLADAYERRAACGRAMQAAAAEQAQLAAAWAQHAASAWTARAAARASAHRVAGLAALTDVTAGLAAVPAALARAAFSDAAAALARVQRALALPVLVACARTNVVALLAGEAAEHQRVLRHAMETTFLDLVNVRLVQPTEPLYPQVSDAADGEAMVVFVHRRRSLRAAAVAGTATPTSTAAPWPDLASDDDGSDDDPGNDGNGGRNAVDGTGVTPLHGTLDALLAADMLDGPLDALIEKLRKLVVQPVADDLDQLGRPGTPAAAPRRWYTRDVTDAALAIGWTPAPTSTASSWSDDAADTVDAACDQIVDRLRIVLKLYDLFSRALLGTPLTPSAPPPDAESAAASRSAAAQHVVMRLVAGTWPRLVAPLIHPTHGTLRRLLPDRRHALPAFLRRLDAAVAVERVLRDHHLLPSSISDAPDAAEASLAAAVADANRCYGDALYAHVVSDARRWAAMPADLGRARPGVPEPSAAERQWCARLAAPPPPPPPPSSVPGPADPPALLKPLVDLVPRAYRQAPEAPSSQPPLVSQRARDLVARLYRAVLDADLVPSTAPSPADAAPRSAEARAMDAAVARALLDAIRDAVQVYTAGVPAVLAGAPPGEGPQLPDGARGAFRSGILEGDALLLHNDLVFLAHHVLRLLPAFAAVRIAGDGAASVRDLRDRAALALRCAAHHRTQHVQAHIAWLQETLQRAGGLRDLLAPSRRDHVALLTRQLRDHLRRSVVSPAPGPPGWRALLALPILRHATTSLVAGVLARVADHVLQELDDIGADESHALAVYLARLADLGHVVALGDPETRAAAEAAIRDAAWLRGLDGEADVPPAPVFEVAAPPHPDGVAAMEAAFQSRAAQLSPVLMAAMPAVWRRMCRVMWVLEAPLRAIAAAFDAARGAQQQQQRQLEPSSATPGLLADMSAAETARMVKALFADSPFRTACLASMQSPAS
ncbi:hypothetical protein CXG81DRAFT_25709 [Caulochytrium protostelioides]|uniref:Uncharacterized protein n=1 Tax=Caulochytrium protostelioides TaxID=1555241 RepID=A0A4P9X8J3_9FUNG|nr:hypothetical protein CXG81DRAFT_25709 [Caulochytrium protostelioides]|eukprot:RKP01613.1 hypothetical protein CXG81DRAFT_25709 [Caulochytrium protostelioides]